MRTGLVFAVILLVVGTAAAQRPRPVAVTDPAQAGPDYALQGEFLGSAYFPGRGMEGCGLQVVALGGGKFDAVCYRGGLPGAGWDRVTKLQYSGQAENGIVTFAVPGGGFTVDGISAVSFDSGGRTLGRLSKINRTSPTTGQPPPAGATVLFDGRPNDLLPNAKLTDDGLLLAGVLTKMPVDAFRLHLEFRTPFMPAARGQARGNSGVYIQQRYEVQILDSFGLEGIENECGGLYRQQRPDVNMCLPPLAWQTYDIWFTPPRFAEDGVTKTANARLTVLHNGVPIHWHREITAKTGGGRPEGPQPLPINLQDHGNPVAFRNIWIVLGQGDNELLAASQARPAVTTTYYRHRCRLFRRR